jgi:hypothetical protein
MLSDAITCGQRSPVCRANLAYPAQRGLHSRFDGGLVRSYSSLMPTVLFVQYRLCGSCLDCKNLRDIPVTYRMTNDCMSPYTMI